MPACSLWLSLTSFLTSNHGIITPRRRTERKPIMSDKALTISLPEELLAQVTAQRIDVQAVVEKALRSELEELSQARRATLEQREALLHQVLPQERIAEGVQALHAGQRILGLSEGQVRVSEDFDDPLPDEEWGDLFQ